MNGKKQVFSKFDSDDKRYGEVTKQHPHTGLYTGITDERSTTDRFPLLLLLFSWVAMTYIGCSSMKGGDPYGLIFPRDYRGSVCGQAKDMKNFPDKYPVFLNGDGVCVDGCPTRNAPLDSVLR